MKLLLEYSSIIAQITVIAASNSKISIITTKGYLNQPKDTETQNPKLLNLHLISIPRIILNILISTINVLYHCNEDSNTH